MERQQIDRTIEKFIVDMERALYLPLLDRDVERGVFHSSKAFFLLLPLLNGERWTDRMNAAAIAVAAVHLAFDAHNSINERDATSTEQQLTVLAGDYLSGIHYKLLASTANFSFIRTLSNTIASVNEMKTMFHHRSPNDAEQVLEGIREIEAGCIVEFLHSFGFSHYTPLAAAALPLLAIDSEIGYPFKTQNFQYRISQDANMNQIITKLRTEMATAMDEANFIAPHLTNEIRSLITPLLGKPI